ncbi:MAG: LapA family protein [Desulfobacterales bacterium]|nr:LapA family protein [Desulfobacterales bacterium]
MNAKHIIGIVLAGLAVVFIVQNVTVIELKFFFWTLSMSRALLMFLIGSAGIFMGWLLHGSFSRRKSRSLDPQGTVQVTHNIAE